MKYGKPKFRINIVIFYESTNKNEIKITKDIKYRNYIVS